VPPPYRPYDPALNEAPVELLYDADDYFPDLATSIRAVTGAKLFIAGRLISPGIEIEPGVTLEDLIVDVLRQPNTACYLLWNATLFADVEAFWQGIQRKTGAGDRLKIIISANLEFDPGARLALANQGSRLIPWGKPGSVISPAVFDRAQEFWQRQFTAGRDGSLRQFTLGSHHQNTVVIAGKQPDASALTGYCGMDLAPGVAGGHTGWHDSCLRVRGDAAFGLLDNFADRWNFELDHLENVVSFGVTGDDELDPNAFYEKTGDPPVETRRTMPVRVDYTADKNYVLLQMASREFKAEIRGSYESLIEDATRWLYLENQYFRHPDIATALVERLEQADELRVTIVLPAYPTEIGPRGDLLALRDRYAAAPDTALLAKATRLGLTIDPFNKATLLLQSRCLADLVDHPRVRIWMPRRPAKGGPARPYIHSRLMVVDDRALFIGSANLNGRSLDGYADSEINLLLTASGEVARIAAKHGWRDEPDSEHAPDYAGTYYARHHLVRYARPHWSIDQALGAFPVGKAAILDYWEAFNQSTSQRVDAWPPTMTRQQLAERLDRFDELPGVDLDRLDWGDFFVDNTAHLL
jgi:phosphatidylserine/phosphatidylglycerophosphate/cardiolipin synthase-like enzyme